MLAENFWQSLTTLRRREPFEPFEVQLVTGDRIRVEHPEALAVGGYGLAVYIGPQSETYRFDHNSVAWFIETLADAPQSGNGDR